ncbi:metallophosphoesterase family protein [Natronolimnohabitans sp. A-GB9]|uniref:metallophosphoesterase family protein n=1 Tax=Natronolimnohabitans sp. A-GB9 TaxID=3069757 RepID=UPI0027AE2513|nr:metallophosphoesterase family protein [Natronolimnohabitans sp. A-GB9]MDQ2052208.1 metallophosphoesterase family protein [Natronolimnohabitans sp. A-GB9]
MEVALLSDIHANLPALEAVLDDCPPVDEVVCAGDIVGYNPWPAECVKRVREIAAVTVQGNHDRAIETPEQYAGNPMAKAGLEYAEAELSDDQLTWLDSLPPRTAFAGDRFQLVHSHPDPEEVGTYVLPMDFPKMRPYLDGHEGIVLGHTHVQHKATIDGRVIVNPGSIGQPRDGNPTAAYAILDTEANDVELRRVEYDVNAVISKIEALDLPNRTGTRLLDGS